MTTVFFDQVLSVQFADGVARVSLAPIVSQDKEGKRIMGVPTQIVTTLPGLIQLQAQINQLMEGLVEKNILRKAEAPGQTVLPS